MDAVYLGRHHVGYLHVEQVGDLAKIYGMYRGRNSRDAAAEGEKVVGLLDVHGRDEKFRSFQSRFPQDGGRFRISEDLDAGEVL